MSALSFGYTPLDGIMYLSRYSDFVSEIVSNVGAWPDGAALEFRFMPDNSSDWTVWSATIVDDTATWSIDCSDVASLLDAQVTAYRLFYRSGTYDLEWSRGTVMDVS